MYDPSGYTGTHIPAILERMERTQAWLARRMGISTSQLCLVLGGRRSITRRFVDRACRALDLPEAVLFFAAPTMLASTPNATDHTLTEVA